MHYRENSQIESTTLRRNKYYLRHTNQGENHSNRYLQSRLNKFKGKRDKIKKKYINRFRIKKNQKALNCPNIFIILLVLQNLLIFIKQHKN